MPKSKYNLTSKIIKYPGMGGWHFLQVDKQSSKKIKDKHGQVRRGWGSIRVVVTLGKSTWKTSIFPDSKSGTYLLPLKAEVRQKEKVEAKDKVKFVLNIQ